MQIYLFSSVRRNLKIIIWILIHFLQYCDTITTAIIVFAEDRTLHIQNKIMKQYHAAISYLRYIHYLCTNVYNTSVMSYPFTGNNTVDCAYYVSESKKSKEFYF